MSPAKVVIIGAGPSGLMAADILSQQSFEVHVYDAMPSAGRKFLMAGKGGMNITHAEPWPQFLQRYGERQQVLQPILDAFDQQALRDWLAQLGIETFVGSSGRVFPMDMKAAPLLRRWLHRLRSRGVQLHMRHRWLGWQNGNVCFRHADEDRTVTADAVILALGGGSWPQLGSDGSWQSILRERGVEIQTLAPSNCGFDVAWSAPFRDRCAGQPLKQIALSCLPVPTYPIPARGELMISEQGLEGSLIYAWSAHLRRQIQQNGRAEIELDLLPQIPASTLENKLAAPRGKTSFSNWLRKRLNLSGSKLALLQELHPHANGYDHKQLAAAIKSLRITLQRPRPIAEAISSAGGLCFSELNQQLMLKRMPGVFCAGEMLDWEAPTGGYLLTACFATGRAAGQAAADWLGHRRAVL